MLMYDISKLMTNRGRAQTIRQKVMGMKWKRSAKEHKISEVGSFGIANRIYRQWRFLHVCVHINLRYFWLRLHYVLCNKLSNSHTRISLFV